MNNKLRIAALSIAAAFICSSTGDFSYEVFNGNNTYVSDDHVIARELSAEIVPANQTAPVIEQLSAACKEKNTEAVSHICDKILDEMDTAKEEVAAYAIDINEWASDEIKERQKNYEDELNVKYAQTAYALNEMRLGKDYEKNLEIISGNFITPDEYHRSDAAPNTEISAKSIERISGSGDIQSVSINSSVPKPDDLKYDGDPQMKELITQLAEALGDPNSIYHFVKNYIKTEGYIGAKKGAAITLAQTGGNDLDQASLLIVLLRAKKIPARYVTGTIQITTEQALEITGASNTNAAGRILASGYKDTKTIYDKDNTIIGFQMIKTWVEAYIPYTDYRGAGNMSGDKIWVQLDPSFKKLESKIENIDADFSDNDIALIETINKVSADNKEAFGDPINLPDKIPYYYNEIKLADETYIPSSLPYTVVSLDDCYSFIKDEDKYTFSVSIGDEDIFSYPLLELYGRPVIINFEPASQDDQEVVERYDKITDVPAYLVNVVPVVSVGDKKFKGKKECSLGMCQEMITRINENGNSTMLSDSIYSGSMYALNLDFQTISPDEAKAAQLRIENAKEKYTSKNTCTTEELGSFLDFAGKYYFSLCDAMDRFLSAEMNINKTRSIGFAITGYQFSMATSFGSVRSLDYGSFYIDVAHNKMSVINYEGNRDLERKFMLSSGMIGSYLEGYIWEQLLDKEKTCISTISVMNVAAQEGIELCYINPNNIDTQLEKCNIRDSVKDEIRNFINKGLFVELVPETLTIGDWTGTAFIAIDLETCSASYMISGGTAGGSSMTFDDLFELNNLMVQINFILADIGILTNYLESSMFGIMDVSGLQMAAGLHGIMSQVGTLSSAISMRYANYNYIMEYALRGEEVMKEYSLFTIETMTVTCINLVRTISSAFGKPGAVVSANLGAIADTEMLIIDSINNAKKTGKFELDTGATLNVIWDYIGLLLSLIC